MLLGLAVVVGTVVPRHEPRPTASLCPYLGEQRHVYLVAVAALGQGDHLVGIVGRELLELLHQRVLQGGIVVAAHDVDHVVAGIPVLVAHLRVPHPDEVVQTLLVDHVVVHPPPEFLVDLGTLGAPPEPGTAALILVGVARCLVERSPDDGDALGLHLLQIAAHLGHLPDGHLVLVGAVLIDFRGVERCFAGLRSRRTGQVDAVVGIDLPVPHTAHDAAGLVPLAHAGVVRVVEPTLGVDIARGVDVDEVKHVDGRPPSRPLVDVLGVARVPVDVGHRAREDTLAVQVAQQGEEPLGLSRRVLVRQPVGLLCLADDRVGSRLSLGTAEHGRQRKEK